MEQTYARPEIKAISLAESEILKAGRQNESEEGVDGSAEDDGINSEVILDPFKVLLRMRGFDGEDVRWTRIGDVGSRRR